MRPFEQKKVRRDEPMQEELLSALKELLSRQKDVELPAPLPAPALQTPLQSISANTWQPSMQVMQLFEEMTSSLSYVNEKGIQMTTITLDGEHFASSIFRNCTLTLTEYSTAPKIFNVQFAVTPEALAFFAPHAQQLQHALKHGEWDFRVERLDVALLDLRHEKEQEKDEKEEKE